MIKCIPINEGVVERVDVTWQNRMDICRLCLLKYYVDDWDGGGAALVLQGGAVVPRGRSSATVLQWEVEVLYFDVVEVEVAIGLAS